MLALVVVIIAALVGLSTLLATLSSKNNRNNRNRVSTSIVCGVSFGIAIVVLIIGSVAIVPNGHVAVMLRFEKTTGQVLDAGFNWKSIIDSPAIMSIQTQKYEVDCEAASQDLQDVTSKIAINYRLNKDKAEEVYRTIGVNYFEVVGHPAIQEVVKAVASQYDAEDMILKRESVKGDITTTLAERLAERGIISEQVNITNFSFSEEFTAAIEAKVSAAQSVLQAQNKLAQIKVEAEQARAKAEGDKNAAILQAEGQKQAAILKAEGESQSIQIVPEAQVAANEKISETLTNEVLQYIFIDRMGDEVQVWVVPDGQGFTLTPKSASTP
jgi:regulator of protease activity HflC (stomatin/prohibitin superfamily)